MVPADFRRILYDFSRYSDEEIRGEVLLKVVLIIMKHISHSELAPKFSGVSAGHDQGFD